MKFLERKRSIKAKESRKDVKQDEESADGGTNAQRERRTSMFQQRPKSANERKSFQRPRTANKISERGQDLTVEAMTMDIKAGGDIFSFPAPSPRLPPTSKSAAPYPSASPRGIMESPPIGVALGSPSHMPIWGRSYTADQISGRIAKPSGPVRAQTKIAEEPTGALPQPGLRRKKSGWKTLGALFQRKPSKPALQEPFYKVQMQPSPSTAEQVKHSAQMGARGPADSPGPMSPGSIASHHSRTPSITRGMARFEARAEADRASLMPHAEKKMMRTPSMIQRQSMVPPAARTLHSDVRTSHDMFKPLPEERQDSPMQDSKRRVPRTPRLDLDIPNGDMERYSVMFEKLLAPKPTILERRQSKLKRIKSTLQRESPPVPALEFSRAPSTPTLPQRSVTSPHLTKNVPSLNVTLLPVKASLSSSLEEEPTTAVHRPRPIQRSKTAPPGSVSPVALNFSRPKPPPTLTSSEESDSSPVYGERSLPPTPTTMTTVDEDEHGHPSIRIASPSPGQHHAAPLLPRNSLNPAHGEPAWHMLTSKPAILLPDEDQEAAGEMYPRVKSPEDLERQIVQVSVARQVSVTKARKQVQRAVESKQPLRPRVVELSKNRKSTVVLIEGGDD